MTHTARSLAEAFGYVTHAEIACLQGLVRSLPADPVVVNVGAGAGTSGLAIVEARDDVRLWTVDVTEESSPLGCLAAEEQVLRAADLWSARVTHVHGDSRVVAVTWTGPAVDLVFVDDGHLWHEVTGDLDLWTPHVRAGGIVAVHDVGKASRDKPWPAVDYACRRYGAGRELVASVETIRAWRVEPVQILRETGMSKVWLADDGRVHVWRPKTLIENEWYAYRVLAGSGYVPEPVERIGPEELAMPYLDRRSDVTDIELFLDHYDCVLELFEAAGLRHGDLTAPHVFIVENRPVIIDWAESRLAGDPRPDKRPEGDAYWLERSMAELVDQGPPVTVRGHA